MPGGVAGAQSSMIAPYADLRNAGFALQKAIYELVYWGLFDIDILPALSR
jgi:hypothetical protein